MGSKKKKRFNPENETLVSSKQSVIPQIFQTILSEIESPEVLKLPLLKSLYYLLIHLSSSLGDCPRKGFNLDESVMEIGQDGIKVSLEDICRISDILLKELCKRFQQLLSAVHDVSASRVLGQARDPHMWATAEDLNLLLRCCMAVLNLLVLQDYFLQENGQVLLVILRKLILLELTGGKEKNGINFETSVSHECTYSDSVCTTFFAEEFVASLCFLEPSDPCIPFLSAMLEVFVDELLVHGQLREYFKLLDSVSSASEILFMRHSSHGDIGIVMEVICSHFSLSFSDEQAFEDFLNRLSSLDGKDFRAPELSLTAAKSLLLNPMMLSAPILMQAHMISLVSEATSVGMGFENFQPDPRFLDCYLSVVERSVILYSKHMSSLQTDGLSAGIRHSSVKSSKCGEHFPSSFELYIQPVTRKKIEHLITKLDDSWHSRLWNMFFRTKSDLVTSSIAFIKESQYVLDISCRDEILSILSCIILRIPSDVNDIVPHINRNTSLQDICLLASILKLMSSSLLQALWCLRHYGNSGCPKTLKNFSSCKEYDFIVTIISHFREFKISQPIQKFLHNMMETYPTTHKESRLMLLHFLGLLSLSFASGLDFLVKGCISTVMALMNLFVFEEGNLEALRSLTDSRLGAESSGLLVANVKEAAIAKNSSLVVASKFWKIQTTYSRTASLANSCRGMDDGQPENLVPDNMKHVVGIEEETCNGEIFLKCLLKDSGKPSDFHDLADFIECNPRKDYSGWLKDKQRFRNQRCEKMAILRLEKKKKTWKIMKRRKA